MRRNFVRRIASFDDRLTRGREAGLMHGMRLVWAMAVLLCVSGPGKIFGDARAHDPDFEFRKFKIFTLVDQNEHVLGRHKTKKKEVSTQTNVNSNRGTQEAAVTFERAYRLYGAISAYDRRQRMGQYFDFFWRAKRRADVTVRFEYKQEVLRAAVQAKELKYEGARGTIISEFRVVGDEFFDDGRVLAWRCLLVENGRVVAEKRSFLWK
ncbi:MAG: hypothetical protein M3R59_06870 [Verrucomicrobiota bacterium]|nr:hypothetical protein [Verrucomicrobiota bacterium]